MGFVQGCLLSHAVMWYHAVNSFTSLKQQYFSNWTFSSTTKNSTCHSWKSVVRGFPPDSCQFAPVSRPFPHFPPFPAGVALDHVGGCTLWLFNIAMENGPFTDGLPIKHGDFPWLTVSHNQMVSATRKTPIKTLKLLAACWCNALSSQCIPCNALQKRTPLGCIVICENSSPTIL